MIEHARLLDGFNFAYRIAHTAVWTPLERFVDVQFAAEDGITYELDTALTADGDPSALAEAVFTAASLAALVPEALVMAALQDLPVSQPDGSTMRFTAPDGLPVVDASRNQVIKLNPGETMADPAVAKAAVAAAVGRLREIGAASDFDAVTVVHAPGMTGGLVLGLNAPDLANPRAGDYEVYRWVTPRIEDGSCYVIASKYVGDKYPFAWGVKQAPELATDGTVRVVGAGQLKVLDTCAIVKILPSDIALPDLKVKAARKSPLLTASSMREAIDLAGQA